MFGFGSNIRYYLYSLPTDMRKGVDGLCGLVFNHLKQDPIDGDVFIFVGKSRRLIKLLFWDQTGFVIYYKRLEAGCFELPKVSEQDSESIEIDRKKLMMIMEGVVLKGAKYKKRYKVKNS